MVTVNSPGRSYFEQVICKWTETLTKTDVCVAESNMIQAFYDFPESECRLKCKETDNCMTYEFQKKKGVKKLFGKRCSDAT